MDKGMPTPRESCCILEQKLGEVPNARGWASAIRAAITVYAGSVIIAGRTNQTDSRIIQSMGKVMSALAVGLLETDPGLEERSKGMETLVDGYLRVPLMFYFGCSLGLSGHGLYGPIPGGFIPTKEEAEKLPWFEREMDGAFCPSEDVAGTGMLHHEKGWTILAVWDRSGDDRSGSNSIFFIEGTVDLKIIKLHASKAFPDFWNRMTKVYPGIKISEGSDKDSE